ncbi:hypothetical protein M1247_31870 [Mycobacterium sp. 21AC1]|uniref:hypothetical protein n=1 Tax=[Mycobacterium] appelbergii TaxID=2939269 RepID=UPI0029392DA9|nr:hypothetical protein [Mycobacterium sp. 21AC1]MDV3129542.1 hypothetical protein [Mycobacterium sp. 21AC1]
MRVTLVRGRLRVVVALPVVSSLLSVVVVGGVDELDVVEVSEVDDVDDPDVSEVSLGNPNSVVNGGRVLVMVEVVVVVVDLADDVDEREGSMKLIGASSGFPPLVNVTTPQTTSAITVRAATLAPSTAGVE